MKRRLPVDLGRPHIMRLRDKWVVFVHIDCEERRLIEARAYTCRKNRESLYATESKEITC